MPEMRLSLSHTSLPAKQVKRQIPMMTNSPSFTPLIMGRKSPPTKYLVI